VKNEELPVVDTLRYLRATDLPKLADLPLLPLGDWWGYMPRADRQIEALRRACAVFRALRSSDDRASDAQWSRDRLQAILARNSFNCGKSIVDEAMDQFEAELDDLPDPQSRERTLRLRKLVGDLSRMVRAFCHLYHDAIRPGDLLKVRQTLSACWDQIGISVPNDDRVARLRHSWFSRWLLSGLLEGRAKVSKIRNVLGTLQFPPGRGYFHYFISYMVPRPRKDF
jgi:hypothetical protein